MNNPVLRAATAQLNETRDERDRLREQVAELRDVLRQTLTEQEREADHLAALEAIVHDVAALWGREIYVRDAQGYESTAAVVHLVERARAVLAGLVTKDS